MIMIRGDEMDTLSEYIDNEVWKVIQNGNSKKRVTKVRMVYTGSSHRRFHGMDDAKEIWAAIKTRFGGNANSKKMQKAVLKQQFEAFTISSKESLEKGYDRFQKLLTQLDALGLVEVIVSYTTSSSKATPTATPGLADEVIHSFLATNADDVDLIHEDLDQIDDLDLEEMDINWQIAMTAIKIKKFYKKTGRRPRVDGKMHVAFDKRKVECFNCHNTGHFARECKFKGTKDGSRQEASRGQDFKPVRTEKEALMTIDEGQINWVEQTTDEEINHALMAFTVNNEVSMCSKLCLDSYNALKAKYDELQSEFGDQEAALTAHKIGLKKVEAQLRASHKQQISLNEKLHFQANQIFEKDEKLKKYRRIGMKAVKDKDALQKIVDSWFASSKNLWKLIDCGMSSTVKLGLGHSIKSNAEVLGYEEEMSRGIFVLRETDEGYYDIPLYSRFKQVEYKGVPPPLSGDYTPRAQEDIDDSLYVYGKHGPQPQSPSPTVSNASSIVFSICPSNDRTVSDPSVNDDPIHDNIPIPSIEQVTIAIQKTQPQVPKPKQTVDPSCAQHVKTPRQQISTPVTFSPIPSNNRQNWNQRMERELGAGYSFERKPCFVCGSLSHLIKDCDYYEKKMAREAALKSKRVVHADVRQATPAWTNTNRVNKANQFTPRPVQLSNIRPNLSTASKTIKTGRVNVNTGHGNVSSGSVHVNSGTQFKSGASRFNTGKQHVNSGSMHVNTGRVNRPVSNNTSPKPSQVNLKSPKKCFSKQRSPVNRPFSRNTAHKSNKYAVKGKMGTAVKTSAGCVWRKIIPLSNTNSGPTPDSNVNVSRGAHLEDYQELSKVGSVTFGGSKGSISGKGTIRLGNLVFDDVAFVKELGHFNLFSISHICDKKLNVLFTEKECFVVSSDFKMPDENQVLLKVPRQHNMYTFDMKNVVSSKAYTCLLAKASSDEAKLWHRRLGHLNFKNLNKLVKDNLVRGLPSKSFKNDHTCVACQKGKQHKASCKAKIDRYVTHPLHTLHMDLFGPTSVRSINHASYCLVITDDYSRFCWVFFLAKKDETSDILKTFIRQIENQLNQKVKIIRSDNGTEFKNRVMLEFCGEKGIKQEFSNARTPQQNGVAERMNRTLIEAARTMLADSHLPTTFWVHQQPEQFNNCLQTFNRKNLDALSKKHLDIYRKQHLPVLLLRGPFSDADEDEMPEISDCLINQLKLHTSTPKNQSKRSTTLSYCLLLSQFEPRKVILRKPLKNGIWVKAMAERTFAVQASTKNKKDERGVVVRNKARLVVSRHRKRSGIDIDEVFAPLRYSRNLTLVNVKAAITPMETKLPLTKDEEAFDVDVHLYRSMIGSLMYLTASRPDIMYAVCVCSRFQVTPKTSHLNAVKRIFKYLKGKPNLGLWYPRESPFDLEAFSDSDYGGSNLDRKSTTGGCQFLGQRLISWQCKKQTIVATSTTEAEYVAAANCCGQVLWVQNQLLDYGFNFMNTKIHIDNESTICIVKNPVYHSKTKHIEIRHHFIRDCYEKKLISVEKIHTDLNVADLLTKPFDGPRFNYLVVSIGRTINSNPTIYDSLVKQFWQTAIAITKADGSLEIKATIDSIGYTITEASIRDTLQLDDASGITMLPNNELFEGMGQMGYRLMGSFTFGKIHSAPPVITTPTPIPASIPSPTPIPETQPEPFAHTFEEPYPRHTTFLPTQEQAQGQMAMDDLLHVVPKLISRIDSLETDLKQTKLTMGNAIVKLVKKVKKLEGLLKKRHVVVSDSEEEEPEAQGRKSQDDPLDSSVQGLVTPSTTKVDASGEEQVEDISPNTLEAAKTLSRVASLKPKSIDKGRRYKRRKETKGKKVVSSLDFQEEVDTGAEQVNTAEGVNTGSIKLSTVSEQLSTGSEQVSTVSAKKSTPSPDKGQREGKAPMISEETPKKSKEQILQEEASLAEAIRLDSLQKEEEAKQIHLDSLLAHNTKKKS
ncbi:putative ribonuclease H-like domain-containing protein [Tanacetum coccineum]